jgi:hypothetical protein
MRHIERHRTAHIGWLRASVLGANDGLISTASQFPGPEEPDQLGGVAPIGLDPVARPAGRQGRGHDLACDATRGDLAMQIVPDTPAS